MLPLWISALYLLLLGLVVLAVVGEIYEEFASRRAPVHGSHPKPMEPSNLLGAPRKNGWVDPHPDSGG